MSYNYARQFLPAASHRPGTVSRMDGSSPVHADGWYNALAGLGKQFDKSNKTFFGSFYFMDRNQLSRMYVGDGLGRKIIDAKADDMTRQWIKITMKDDNERKLIETQMKKLKVPVFFNEAIKWERLFGGSVIVLGAMDGLPLDAPLDINRCKSIEWLKVVDQWDIDLPSSEWDRDPTSPTYGQIMRYMCQFRVSGTGRIDRLMVHNTRVLPFYGENIPKSLVMGDQRTRYWGASVLQAIWENLATMGASMQVATNILMELTIGKYTLPNLAEMLASGNEQAIQNRMSAIQMSKSVINAVLLGKDETYQRDTLPLGGLPELLDRFMMWIAAVSSYPVTKLFGRSPGGLNATGESDITNYYDDVKSKQRTDLEPNINKLLLLMAQINKIKEIPTFEFNPLVQSDPMQEAQIKQKEASAKLAQAQIDQIYIVNQVASPEEIAHEREFIDDDEYAILRGEIPGDEDLELQQAKLKAAPGEGSTINPGTVEKNLLDLRTEKKPSLTSKAQSTLKQPNSAIPPVNNPGVPIY